MQAAAHGNSTIGIPAKVGKEFVAGQSPKGLPKKAPSAHAKVKAGLAKAFPKG